MADRKDPSLNPAHQAILTAMLALPENRTCADCAGPAPRWASTNLGCFLCIACSGYHRNIGSHVSAVRSPTLDTWTANQVAHFRTLGNAASAALYEAHLPPSFSRPTPANALAMDRFIRDKYERKLFTTSDGVSAAAAVSQTSPASKASRQDDYRHDPDRHNPYAVQIQAILDMGFAPAQTAAALSATRGNIPRAVETLLHANSAADNAPPRHALTKSPGPRSAHSPPPQDLVNFNAPPQQSTSAKTPPIASAPPPIDDDFADFGAFESALPSPPPAPSAAGTPSAARTPSAAKTPSPSRSRPNLTALYAQGPALLLSSHLPRVKPSVQSNANARLSSFYSSPSSPTSPPPGHQTSSPHPAPAAARPTQSLASSLSSKLSSKECESEKKSPATKVISAKDADPFASLAFFAFASKATTKPAANAKVEPNAVHATSESSTAPTPAPQPVAADEGLDDFGDLLLSGNYAGAPPPNGAAGPAEGAMSFEDLLW